MARYLESSVQLVYFLLTKLLGVDISVSDIFHILLLLEPARAATIKASLEYLDKRQKQLRSMGREDIDEEGEA